MKRYLVILLTILFVFTPSIVKAENLTPKVDENEKIYDYAELLSEEGKTKLHELVLEFSQKYNMDMVLVTINDNPYGNADSDTLLYADDFYDFNKFGVGTSRDGVIILIDMDNRLPAMVATGKAILIFSDARVDSVLDSMYDYLASADYFGAFEQGIKESSRYVEMGPTEYNNNYYIDEEGQYIRIPVETKKSVDWIVSIGAGIVVSVGAFLIHLRKYRGIKLAVNANEYLKDSQVTNTMDQFLTTFTSRVRRSSDNSSHGGGGFGGGGSSIHHGSSGMSHSGGVGRHF